MKPINIFLSYASKDAKLIEDFSRYMPKYLETWIDVKRLRWGEPFSNKIESAIKKETDYVVLFLSENSLKSEWVKRELAWALEQEALLNRPFLLPIMCGNNVLPNDIGPLSTKVFKTIENYESDSVSKLVGEVIEEIFKHVVQSLREFQSHPIHNCGRFGKPLQEIASELQKALESYSEVPLQEAFIGNHADLLLKSLVTNSRRLRIGEIVTDYDDMSLLTQTIKNFASGDHLLGLTDWDVDREWWRGDDAQEFLEANKCAIARGADIQRIFVHAEHAENDERLKELESALREHVSIGVVVYHIHRDSVRKGTREFRSQCVLSHVHLDQSAKPWLAYDVELDSQRIPLRNVFHLNEVKISEHLGLLNGLLDSAVRYNE